MTNYILLPMTKHHLLDQIDDKIQPTANDTTSHIANDKVSPTRSDDKASPTRSDDKASPTR